MTIIIVVVIVAVVLAVVLTSKDDQTTTVLDINATPVDALPTPSTGRSKKLL